MVSSTGRLQPPNQSRAEEAKDKHSDVEAIQRGNNSKAEDKHVSRTCDSLVDEKMAEAQPRDYIQQMTDFA